MEGLLRFDLDEPSQQAVMRTMLRASDMVLCLSAWQDTMRAKIEELEDAEPESAQQEQDRDTRLALARELQACFDTFLADYDLARTVSDPDVAMGAV